MTGQKVPLTRVAAVALAETAQPGVCRAVPAGTAAQIEAARGSLSWDRVRRLERAARELRRLIGATAPGQMVLDVGGFDGALALFLPGMALDVIDPATTGGSATELPCQDRAYTAVVSVDALEHIEPSAREKAVSEHARAAARFCLLNFPSSRSKRAQELVLELTGNPLVAEHVNWPLPEADLVAQQLESSGFSVEIIEHTSTALWVAQYLLQTRAPGEAAAVCRFLLEHHAQEPPGLALYDLVVAERRAGG